MSLFSQLFGLILVLITTTTVLSDFTFTPYTSSNWSSFTCFTKTELTEVFDEQTLSSLHEIGKNIDLLFDDWGLSSLAASIIMKEILGYNILLSSYSHSDTLNIIVNSSYIASSLEIYPNYLNTSQIYHYSIGNPLIIDQQLGVQSFTSWYISNTFINHINSTNNDEIWLDWWKTYTLPQITDQLLNANEFQSLNITDNKHLWNPSKCDNNECNILITTETDYDLELNKEIINDYNLTLSIKYVPTDEYINELGILYSLSSPSLITNSNTFQRISLGSKYDLLHTNSIHKYIPSILKIISNFGFDFLQSLKMTNIDYNIIYSNMINDSIINNENTNDRLNGVCKWLKTNDIWTSWIPNTNYLNQYTNINCGLYSDRELSTLLYLRHNPNISHINSPEIATELYNKLQLYQQSSFNDLWTAIRVNNKCISTSSNYPISLLIIQIIACILIFYIFICFILVFISRHEVIIIAASYPLLLSFLFGACIGCLVPIFGSPSKLYYILEILCIHTTIILMFCSLIGKSWRLHKIIQNALKGQTTDITTCYIFKRILIICIIAWIYWGIIIIFKFGNIIETYIIYDQIQYYKIIMTNDKLFTFIILIFEFCLILWGARIAWNLRSVNPQFNESKHIAVILYHTFFIVLLVAIFFILLQINPHILRILWMSIWLLMIAFAVSVLFIPKFRAIYHGVEYADRGLMDRRKTSGSTRHTSHWIPKQLKTEQVQELANVLRKLGFKVQRQSKHVSAGSSTNILKKRNVRKYHSASVGDEQEFNDKSANIHNGHKRTSNNLSVNYTLKNDHLRTQSAALPPIKQLNINTNYSNESVIIHSNINNENEPKVSSLSAHRKNAATVLGLPPPSTWEYDDSNEEESSDDNTHPNEGVRYSMENNTNHTHTHNTNENIFKINIKPARPPPLPIHIKKQFNDNNGRKKVQTRHQRSVTSPVTSPHSAISMVSSVSPISPPHAEINNNVFPKKLPPKQLKINKKGGNRISDIIAKFNYINVNVDDEDYID